MTLDDLRKIAENATPGPWEYRGDYFGIRQVPTEQHLVSPNKYEMEGIVPGEHIRPEDAEFIATFNPERVLEMIDTLRGAEIRLDHAKTVIDRLQTRLAAVEKLYEERCAETVDNFTEAEELFLADLIKAARGE